MLWSNGVVEIHSFIIFFYFTLRIYSRGRFKNLLLLLLLLLLFAHQHKAAVVKSKQNVKQRLQPTSYSVFIMFRKETAFPRCRAMDRRWNRKTVSLVSWVMTVVRLPISWTSSMAMSSHVLAVLWQLGIIIIIIIINKFTWSLFHESLAVGCNR